MVGTSVEQGRSTQVRRSTCLTGRVHPTIEALAARLHVEPERLSMLEGRDPADVAGFDVVVARTIESEDAAVSRGFNDSLKLLPPPVRLALKKIVFGSRR